MLTFTTLALWLHVTAIVIWVGGLFALSFVLIPVLRGGIGSPAERSRLIAAAVHRFQRISRELIFLIVLTGIFNFINAGVARGFHFSAIYIGMLVSKVALFAVVIGIQAWQSLRLVPAIVSIASATESVVNPAQDALQKNHRRFLLTSILNLVVAAAVILLGLALRYR